MADKNPFLQNTYEWHGFELKRPEEKEQFGLVWVHNDFFFDYQLQRPKAFPLKEAHLYAILFILSGKADFVFVENAAEYHRKKYFPNRKA